MRRRGAHAVRSTITLMSWGRRVERLGPASERDPPGLTELPRDPRREVRSDAPQLARVCVSAGNPGLDEPAVAAHVPLAGGTCRTRNRAGPANVPDHQPPASDPESEGVSTTSPIPSWPMIRLVSPCWPGTAVIARTSARFPRQLRRRVTQKGRRRPPPGTRSSRRLPPRVTSEYGRERSCAEDFGQVGVAIVRQLAL